MQKKSKTINITTHEKDFYFDVGFSRLGHIFIRPDYAGTSECNHTEPHTSSATALSYLLYFNVNSLTEEEIIITTSNEETVKVKYPSWVYYLDEGRKMPSTDYSYVITLKERAKSYMGHFTLLR